jgi:hypothetical protein
MIDPLQIEDRILQLEAKVEYLEKQLEEITALKIVTNAPYTTTDLGITTTYPIVNHDWNCKCLNSTAYKVNNVLVCSTCNKFLPVPLVRT